eukprot:scaffold13711_cov28-Tisochrysis_lutea.AAC.1
MLSYMLLFEAKAQCASIAHHLNHIVPGSNAGAGICSSLGRGSLLGESPKQRTKLPGQMARKWMALAQWVVSQELVCGPTRAGVPTRGAVAYGPS